MEPFWRRHGQYHRLPWFLTHSRRGQVGHEAVSIAMGYKNPGKTPVEPEVAVHCVRITLHSRKLSPRRRYVLTGSEQQRRIWKWKDPFECLPRCWKSLQEKQLVGTGPRPGVSCSWEPTSGSLTCTVLWSLSWSLPSAVSQEWKPKSALKMPESISYFNKLIAGCFKKERKKEKRW